MPRSGSPCRRPRPHPGVGLVAAMYAWSEDCAGRSAHQLTTASTARGARLEGGRSGEGPHGIDRGNGGPSLRCWIEWIPVGTWRRPSSRRRTGLAADSHARRGRGIDPSARSAGRAKTVAQEVTGVGTERQTYPGAGHCNPRTGPVVVEVTKSSRAQMARPASPDRLGRARRADRGRSEAPASRARRHHAERDRPRPE